MRWFCANFVDLVSRPFNRIDWLGVVSCVHAHTCVYVIYVDFVYVWFVPLQDAALLWATTLSHGVQFLIEAFTLDQTRRWFLVFMKLLVTQVWVLMRVLNQFWDGKVLCDLDISGFIVCRFIQRTYCISHPKKRPFAFIWDVLWVRELGLYGSLWQILHSRLEYYTSKSQRKCQIIVQLSLCAWFLVFFLPMLRLFYPLCFSS